MPHYRKYGKIATPITEEEFKKGMDSGHFVSKKHRGFCVLLYYSAVRKMEALRSLKEQFTIEPEAILFDVGKRLKKQKAWLKETPPLRLGFKAPFIEDLKEAIEHTRSKKRVFPYCPKTGYNIVARVFKYPHLFRLSRITWFFEHGWPISKVRSWSGLSLRALDAYIGIVDIREMGEDLR